MRDLSELDRWRQRAMAHGNEVADLLRRAEQLLAPASLLEFKGHAAEDKAFASEFRKEMLLARASLRTIADGFEAMTDPRKTPL